MGGSPTAASGTETELYKEQTKHVDARDVTKRSIDIYSEPNTISHTAHIHGLFFKPREIFIGT